MPKRILLLAFAATALALAACNSGRDVNDLYGTPVPTATATIYTPNPSASAATVEVYVSNSPYPNQLVSLYSATSSETVGTLITTQVTSGLGVATFTGLTPEAYYCFVTVYTPTTGLAQKGTNCTNLWGAYTIDFYLGN